MQKTCTSCSASFEVTDDDLAFYDKVSPVFGGQKYLIPPPTHCPQCRMQRRLAFRNQMYVFRCTSAATGKQMFSRWPDTVSFPVYENDYWHDGDWNPLSYGRSFDFTRSFFEQIKDLYDQTPKTALAAIPEWINSDYCNNATNIKNCYLVFGATDAEDCMCCELTWYSRDCLECSTVLHSELCYDCVSCYRCYDLQSSRFCYDCTSSYFLMNCRSCTNCFGCVNLRHQQYCFFNEQLTQQEYEKRLSEIDLSSYTQRQRVEQTCIDFFHQHPRPHASNTQVEDVSGDFITESKAVHNSFYVSDAENVQHCYYLYGKVKDCMDHSLYGNSAELNYETVIGGGNAMHLLFCAGCFNTVSDLTYCIDSHYTHHCFGCCSMRRNQYCILNTQYTEAEYNDLVPKIIEYMKSTGEWGEFFPMALFQLPYNKSLAQRFFPLSKEEVQSKGLAWYEEDVTTLSASAECQEIPDTPQQPQSFIARSPFSGKPYRISVQEIEMCKKLHVPLPRGCYDERMEKRAEILGGMKLYDRVCAKTGQPIKTTILPDDPWIVWDKDVYEQEFSS